MPIIASQISPFKSALNNNTDTNGGRMSSQAITTNVMNNLFPDVSQSERLSGSTLYRKLFYKIGSPDGLALISPKIMVSQQSPGDDRVLIFPATQTDTQANKVESRLYGCGTLNADASVGATSIGVNVENSADAIFQVGDLIYISNKATPDDANGTSQFLTIATVSWNGSLATLTFAGGESLSNGYFANTPTRVSSVIVPGESIQASWEAWAGSTTAGLYNGNPPATPPTTIVPILDAIGSVYQNWTFTFTSPTAFTCTGDTVGAVGAGTIGANFAPNNAAFSKPYFTLPSAGWGGTWAATETLTFRTLPASTAVWVKRIVPPNAASVALDKFYLTIIGASA